MAAGGTATVLTVSVAVRVVRDVLVAVIPAALGAGSQLYDLDMFYWSMVAVLAPYLRGIARSPVLLAFTQVALSSLDSLNILHDCEFRLDFQPLKHAACALGEL